MSFSLGDAGREISHPLNSLDSSQLKSMFVPQYFTRCAADAGGACGRHGKRALLPRALFCRSLVQLFPLSRRRLFVRYLWETKGEEARCFYRWFSSLAHAAGEREAGPAVYFWFLFDFMISDCAFGISVMTHGFI